VSFADRFQISATAQEEFADRNSEQSAFDETLEQYVRRFATARSPWEDFGDPLRPRENLLTYYGVGGIGKTTLIARLSSRLTGVGRQPDHWPSRIELPIPTATCVIDMSDFDAEDAVLLIRGSLTALGARFPAFDLALARYWGQRHADTSIVEMFRRKGRLSRLAESIGVAEHIQSAMEETCEAVLGTSIPGVTAFRAFAQVGELAWRKRIEHTTLRDCPGLGDLLEMEATSANLAYLGYALAWDLARIQGDSGASLVIFVDTMEASSALGESFINRLTWMLPNALFVLASRNLLTWAEREGDLEFKGPGRWPTLEVGRTSEPRQHLIGYLSMEDRLRWLSRVLGDACSEDVLVLAARESQGLPVHLDLIAQHVRNVARTRRVVAADVQGDIGSVARRVLRDLTDSQRRALLASSLYTTFDLDLVRDTAGLSQSGPVAELARRPYVEHLPGRYYPYRVHDVLRGVFQSATGLGDDQWLAGDWAAAAQRGIDHLRTRMGTSQSSGQYLEEARHLFELIATFGMVDPWFGEVAQQLTQNGVWDAEWATPPIVHLQGARTWSIGLAEIMEVVMTRQTRRRSEVARQLRAVLTEFPNEPCLASGRYFLAEALRDAGDVEGARRELNALVPGPLAGRATHALIHLYRREGEFGDARRLLEENRGSIRSYARLKADVSWSAGRLSDAVDLYLEGKENASRGPDLGEMALCDASIAWCRALSGDLVGAEAAIEEARTLLRSDYRSFADLMMALAEATVVGLRSGDLTGFRTVDSAARRLEHTSIVAYSAFAEYLVASAVGQSTEQLDAQSRLRENVHGRVFLYLDVVLRSLRGPVDEAGLWFDRTVVEQWKANFLALRRSVDG